MGDCKDFSNYGNYSEYYTPKYAWENIKHLIPKDKIVWEACMLNSEKSKSGEYLKDLCKEVICDTKMNMLIETPKNYDMIITNPPYESKLKKSILKRLVELDKPFIIIINSMNVYSKYMREIFNEKIKDLQVVNPKLKIHFIKLLENNEIEYKPNTSFYCVYLCYKMNIPNEQLWLL